MKFIDLFSGIGGFRLGMEMAGHECVGYIEIDKYARQSYKAIHNTKGEWTANDIRAVDPWELPEADCYTAGFPCQSFSIAGKRGGFKDTRGTLFFEIMRLAEARKPKYLFLENVRGLLSHDGGKTFGTILSSLWELGYDAEWQVLNSKDHGVPQNRERVFIVGHLRGKSGRKIFPIREDGKQDNRLQGQLPYTNTLTARYAAAQATGNYIVEGKQYAQNKIKQIVGGSQGYRVYSVEGVATTLAGAKTELYAVQRNVTVIQKTHGNTITVKNNETGTLQSARIDKVPCIENNTRIRRLTPLECWRLQGFPDWAFQKAKYTGISDSQLYKQAGNAVTVNVVYEIAKRLKEAD